MSAYLRKRQAKWAGEVRAPSARSWIRRFYRRGMRPAAREVLVAGRRLVPGKRMLPGFLIIGAQRAGTTSLFSYLLQHPNVLPALAKEIGYFDVHYLNRSFSWYLAHFPRGKAWAGQRSRSITGEATPDYLYDPAVPERVHGKLPDVRLIVLLRDPVARAYSQYQHSVDLGFEHLPFEKAIREEPARLQGTELGVATNHARALLAHRHFSYLDRGIYHRHLSKWLEYFPRSQIMVVETERLAEDVHGIMREVFATLDLEPVDVGPMARLNVRHYSPIPPSLEERLREFYRPHNEKLRELLGQAFRWAA
jgi:hypothetical protein